MRILLVTSNRDHCGVREYGRMLKEELERNRPHVDVVEYAEPNFGVFRSHFFNKPCPYDLIWVNHHAALHSSWREEQVVEARAVLGLPVVVTQHDTFEELEIMEERGFPSFQRAADALVVHEPVAGLTHAWLTTPPPYAVHYLRQGVLRAAERRGKLLSEHLDRPVVGTVGFPFPWKNFEMLVTAAGQAGWVPLLLAPGIDEDELIKLMAIAHTYGTTVLSLVHWMPREEVVAALASCDATAFLYTTGNSGTSGAIRLGLAARRPLLAMMRCRQFRDLWAEPSIDWVADHAGVRQKLEALAKPGAREASTRGIEKLALKDSWALIAAEYLDIFHAVISRRKGK